MTATLIILLVAVWVCVGAAWRGVALVKKETRWEQAENRRLRAACRDLAESLSPGELRDELLRLGGGDG